MVGGNVIVMKKLLIILLLFFSLPVFAGGLIGIKLICIGDPTKVKNYAFSFENNMKLKMWESYPSGRVEIKEFKHNPYPNEIRFNETLERVYFIDRKTLDLLFNNAEWTKRSEDVKLATCELTEEDPLLLLWEIVHSQIDKLKEGNII